MSDGWEADSPGDHGDEPPPRPSTEPPRPSTEPPRPSDDLKAPLAVLIVIAAAFLLGLVILALSMAFD